jgi:hypothetical protein
MAAIMSYLAMLETRGSSPGILDDASIDVAGVASGCSAVPSGRLVLL